jgi:hypothetical protein
MANDRSNDAFFAVIAANVSAAVALVALLAAGQVAGPRVAMNNLLSTEWTAGHYQLAKSFGRPP